jgi:hypothetical protein
MAPIELAGREQVEGGHQKAHPSGECAIQIVFSMPMVRQYLEAIEIASPDGGTVPTGTWSLSADWLTATYYFDAGQELTVGKTYTGKVTRILNFGAMVEILPGKEGLVHVSDLSHSRVGNPHEVVTESLALTTILKLNEAEVANTNTVQAIERIVSAAVAAARPAVAILSAGRAAGSATASSNVIEPSARRCFAPIRTEQSRLRPMGRVST